MECPFCKYYVPEGASVCGHCGAEEVEKTRFHPEAIRLNDFVAVYVLIVLAGVCYVFDWTSWSFWILVLAFIALIGAFQIDISPNKWRR